MPSEGLSPPPIGILARCLWGFGVVSVPLSPMMLGQGHTRGERDRDPPGPPRCEKVGESPTHPPSTFSGERDTEPLVPRPAQAFPGVRGMETPEHPPGRGGQRPLSIPWAERDRDTPLGMPWAERDRDNPTQALPKHPLAQDQINLAEIKLNST